MENGSDCIYSNTNMKSIAILLLLVHLSSSCVAYKNLTKRETITHDFLTHMKTDRKYIFELKIGIKQFVKVHR